MLTSGRGVSRSMLTLSFAFTLSYLSVRGYGDNRQNGLYCPELGCRGASRCSNRHVSGHPNSDGRHLEGWGTQAGPRELLPRSPRRPAGSGG